MELAPLPLPGKFCSECIELTNCIEQKFSYGYLVPEREEANLASCNHGNSLVLLLIYSLETSDSQQLE